MKCKEKVFSRVRWVKGDEVVGKWSSLGCKEYVKGIACGD